ncbi:ubiquitin-60S ribosomal protein L40-like [Protopterus annectens]|uniref:ubiquitin-60S ribosomal protein L40-like n=1 Tax=Protopterus annectens TaxID=7888 RepID=UPI001CF99F64|nr:ubiquitin-60S ribosomal protein L40-like [Protopterus annectens]
MGKIFQVFVIGIKNEKITLDVAESETQFKSTTVGNVKKLQDRVPGFSECRLLFADTQLEDDKTLSNYGIEDKSTLTTILMLPGGFTPTV